MDLAQLEGKEVDWPGVGSLTRDHLERDRHGSSAVFVGDGGTAYISWQGRLVVAQLHRSNGEVHRIVSIDAQKQVKVRLNHMLSRM